MQVLPLLLVTAFTLQTDASPQFEAKTLSGDVHGGTLLQLTGTELVLTDGKDEIRVPVAQLLFVRLSDKKARPVPDRKPARVYLMDGSEFSVAQIGVANRKATVKTSAGGQFSVPASALSHIRFAPADAKVTDAWKELVARDSKEDMLVVSKAVPDQNKFVLDHLDGVIGDVDDRAIRLLLDGDEIPLNRSKVYGIIYARREANLPKAVCRIECSDGNVFQAQQVILKDNSLHATIIGGASVSLAVASVHALDFSAGKLRYLSDMEPTKVEYTPYFDVVFKYTRDTNLDRDPLQIGKTTYEKGLSIHSKTLLRYRLAADYRRFQTVMGIDYVVARKGAGDVHVVISGDGKTILETDVRHNDKPRKLDLDISGVRDLEILVDFGSDLDISDHLDLADAKVIK